MLGLASEVTESCSVVSNSLRTHGLSSWNSPGQNTGVGSLSLLQGIFPTQGLNPGLPHCRQILNQLSHKWSPRILEWVVYPFSRGSSRPRNRSGVSHIAGGFFTNWTMYQIDWSTWWEGHFLFKQFSSLRIPSRVWCSLSVLHTYKPVTFFWRSQEARVSGMNFITLLGFCKSFSSYRCLVMAGDTDFSLTVVILSLF